MNRLKPVFAFSSATESGLTYRSGLSWLTITSSGLLTKQLRLGGSDALCQFADMLTKGLAAYNNNEDFMYEIETGHGQACFFWLGGKQILTLAFDEHSAFYPSANELNVLLEWLNLLRGSDSRPYCCTPFELAAHGGELKYYRLDNNDHVSIQLDANERDSLMRLLCQIAAEPAKNQTRCIDIGTGSFRLTPESVDSIRFEICRGPIIVEECLVSRLSLLKLAAQLNRVKKEDGNEHS